MQKKMSENLTLQLNRDTTNTADACKSLKLSSSYDIPDTCVTDLKKLL